MEKFGTKLRSLRKQRKLTMKQLAEALGFSAHSYISELESGRGKPSVELVSRIAAFFSVSTDQLISDELAIPNPEGGVHVVDATKRELARVRAA